MLFYTVTRKRKPDQTGFFTTSTVNSCILGSVYGDLLLDISDLLQDKVEEAEFWRVDGDFLDRLGLMVMELNDMKAMARMRGIMEKK